MKVARVKVRNRRDLTNDLLAYAVSVALDFAAALKLLAHTARSQHRGYQTRNLATLA